MSNVAPMSLIGTVSQLRGGGLDPHALVDACCDRAEPAARELFERQVEALAAAGYQVRRVRVFEDAEAVTASLRRLVNGELAREHAKLFERHRDRYRPQTAAGIQAGLLLDERQLLDDRRAVLERRRHVEAQRWSAGVDVWLSPAACGPAPAGIASSGSPWLSVPWSYVGLPRWRCPPGRSAACRSGSSSSPGGKPTSSSCPGAPASAAPWAVPPRRRRPGMRPASRSPGIKACLVGTAFAALAGLEGVA